jgi:D-alanine-D-alanine ligase
MKKFRVALLANLKENAPKFEGMAEDKWDDLDSESTVNALVNAIIAGGNSCEFLEGISVWSIRCQNSSPIYASTFARIF